MEASDHELLGKFVREKSENAFQQMVQRHLNLVFATARRVTEDTHRAEEITQEVFLILAKKAAVIKSDQPLAGWLYHTTRNTALNAVRSDRRRQQREQSAFAMQQNSSVPPAESITTELEEAMDELPAEDHNAVVLRFLDNRRLREVGTELGISEEAARKRVDRALEKLRGIFEKRGIAVSESLLASTLTAQAASMAPAALGATIITSALSQAAAASTAATATINTTTAMTTLFNLKTTAVVLGVAAVTGTSTYLVKENEANQLRVENQSLNLAHMKLAEEQKDVFAKLQLRDNLIASLRKDTAELSKLRGEVDSLQRELDAVSDENDRLRNVSQSKRAEEHADLPDNSPEETVYHDNIDLIKHHWGTELTASIDPATKERLHQIIVDAYAEKEANAVRPPGLPPEVGFGASRLTMPEFWEGYDIDNPRYFYSHENQEWRIVYSKNDAMQTRQIIHVHADGTVTDSGMSYDRNMGR